MFLYVLQVILPVFAGFAAGLIGRKRLWLDDRGCACVKDIIMKIILPLSLFNAMLFNNYSSKTLIIIATGCVSMYLMYAISLLLRHLVPSRKKYFPFAMTSWEGGCIGVPLALLAYGTSGMSNVGLLDFGHGLFLFIFAIPFLQLLDGKKPGVKEIVKMVFTIPVFDAILLGVVLGSCGVGSWLSQSSLYPVFESVINSITGSLGFLIMMTVGYSFKIDKGNMKEILLTCFLRLILGCSVCALAVFTISRFSPMSRDLIKVFILVYTLPPSYGLPSFAKMEGNLDYISGVISVSTIISLLVFTVLLLIG